MATLPLPPDYHRHELIYARDPAASGWNPAAVDGEILALVFQLLAAARIQPPAQILELGCGMGNLTLPLARAGFRMDGIDISPTAVRQAAHRAAAQGLDASFWTADITREPLTRGGRKYAAILDGLFWHCVVGSDRQAVLRSVAGALQAGGVFLVITMCGLPRSPRLAERFDPATRCITDGEVAERYLGDAASLIEELQRAAFRVCHQRVVEGDAEREDQDLLLAVARAARVEGS